MYCVKCGVKLADGVKKCPLCNTPVMIESNIEDTSLAYSSKFPKENYHEKYVKLGTISAILLIAFFTVMSVCLKLYGQLRWGGIVMMSLALFDVIFVIPFWFKKYKPMIFIPTTFGSILGFLLYINCYLNQHWFLKFAFPLVLIIFVDVILGIALYRYIKGGRLFITGGYLIFIGLSSMLIELFQHIMFNSKMFLWSIPALSSLSIFGLFLIICGIIKPLRNYIERKFFL